MIEYNPLFEAFVDYKSNHFCPAVKDAAARYGFDVKRVGDPDKMRAKFELKIDGATCKIYIDFARDELARIPYLIKKQYLGGRIEEVPVSKVTRINTCGNETVKKFADDVKHLIEDKEHSIYYFSGMSVEVI